MSPIQSIQLEEFQSHKSTILNLSPGVNIIWGETDAGKSSVIRGVRWVVLNRPQGDEFRRIDTDRTAVTLNDVQRIRTNSKNEYKIGNKTFKALRTAVPVEVSTSLNLSEANIQAQHQVYFLVDDSPGQRSKVLNEVAGLQVMDKVLKKTNQDIREVNVDLKAARNNVRSEKKEITRLRWVNAANTFLKKLEDYEAKFSEMQDTVFRVEPIITAIDLLEKDKEELLPDEFHDELDYLIKSKKILAYKKGKYQDVSALISRIDDLKKQQSSITVIDVTELEKQRDKIDSELLRLDRILTVVENIEIAKSECKHVSEKLKKTEAKITQELRRLGKCPMCQTTIK